MARYDRKDHYHQKAQQEGYASRAAYKLAEVQQKQRLLRKGQRVVDLGCWPGGWLQVAAEAVGPRGRVVGADIAAIDPPLDIANVVSLQLDLGDPDAAARILEALGGRRADVLLSDAAPKLTGIRDADRAREEEVLLSVEALVPALLRPGGHLLVKLLDCPEARTVLGRVRRGFAKAREFKPSASRKGTTERYLLALGYRPPET